MKRGPWAELPLEGVEGVGLPQTLGMGSGTSSQPGPQDCIPAVSLTSWVTLSKLFNLSVQNGFLLYKINSGDVIELY